MFFLPLICLILGVVFVAVGYQHHETRMKGLGFALILAAAGTGMITFFAVNALG